MATIATHNGSSVSRGHNLRKDKIVSKESHIDPEGIHETWYDVEPRQMYEKLFGQAVDEYNSTQTRSDRKITNYYNEVCADQRRHVTYEMIIGVYSEDNESIKDKDGKDILKGFVDTWNTRNPNLELTGVYYHADEQGKAPHVHIDYIPVAHGYNRGPSVQNGLVKALGEMGFTGKAKNTAQIQWQKRENQVLEALCNRKDITVSHPQEDKGVKHVNTELYKAKKDLEHVKDSTTVINEQKVFAKEHINQLNGRKNELSKSVKELSSGIAILQGTKNKLHETISLLQQEQERIFSQNDVVKKMVEKKQKQLQELNERYEQVKNKPPKQKVIEVEKEVLVEKIIEVKKEVEVPKYIYVEVPIEVEKEVLVEKEVEVPIEKIIPVERIVEVKKEVLVEKVVEINRDYRKIAEMASNAFRLQDDWMQKKGLLTEAYNALSYDQDYMDINDFIYGSSRSR